LDYHARFPLEGYRRLTFMMLDADVVACSPASVYRVLSSAGLLDRWNKKPSKKGTGFVQPLRPHEHWHIDISYLNLGAPSTTSARFSTGPAASSYTLRFAST
jgi:putative transposase